VRLRLGPVGGEALSVGSVAATRSQVISGTHWGGVQAAPDMRCTGECSRCACAATATAEERAAAPTPHAPSLQGAGPRLLVEGAASLSVDTASGDRG